MSETLLKEFPRGTRVKFLPAPRSAEPTVGTVTGVGQIGTKDCLLVTREDDGRIYKKYPVQLTKIKK